MKKIVCTLIALILLSLSTKGQITTLINFSGTANGANPMGSLISDGTYLYGMTQVGGANNDGIIFKVKPDGTSYTDLLNFTGTNGSQPYGSLLYDGTYLYGMTSVGGANNKGLIFKIKPDGTGYADLLDFNGTNGANPEGSLISDGTYFYGMTQAGGANNDGLIFKINSDGSGYTNLLNFNGTNGASPMGSLTFDGTYLYGMTKTGGANSYGNIFKIETDGSGYIDLLDFSGANGAYPYGSLIYDATYLYGMTYEGGGPYSAGNIFKIKKDGSGFVSLLAFDFSNGARSMGSLITDGVYLYGIAEGAENIFQIKKDGSGFTSLASFSTGVNPVGDLLLIGGQFYGMTQSGGASSLGTVFKLAIPPGAALNFDGIDDNVILGNVITNTSAFTKEAWVYANATGNCNIISSSKSPFWINNGNLSAQIAGTIISDPSTFTAAVWTHVAVTYNSANKTLTLYKNGIQVAQNMAVGSYVVESICIGGYPPAPSNFFNGSIDEIRIWNRALCATEIKHNMKAEIATNATGLLAYYKCNQGFSKSNNLSVVSLTDETSNHNGAIYQFALTGATSNFIAPGAVTTGSTVTVFTNTLSAVATQTNVTCYGGATGTASVTPNGTDSPFTYTWSSGGSATSSATNVTAGTYTCITANACGTTTTNTVTITQPTAALAASSVSGTIACNGGTTTVTVSATGGTTPYTNSGIKSSIAAGSYTYTVTDANSCSATTTVSIAQPTLLAASSTSGTIACNGGITTVTVSATGGTTPYSGNGIKSSIATGSYTYTVTDAHSCSATTTITVIQPTILAASSTSGTILCNGGATTVTVSATGGTTPYTNNGIMSNIAAGSYTYTITDAHSCAATTTITVIQPTVLATSSTSGTIVCNDGATTVTVSATGGTTPYTNNGIMSNVAAGSYTYTVTDAHSCAATTTVNITQPTALSATVTASPTGCTINNGSVSIIATGGTGALTYAWLPSGATTNTVNNLAQGIYTCTVTDVNACSITKTSNVTTAGGPTVTVTGFTNEICNGGATGSATVSAIGGAGSYTYSWSPSGGTAVAATNLTANNYACLVTDINGCASTQTISITEPTAVNASATSGTILCNGGATTVTVSATGGTSPYIGSGTFANLTANNYTYTVTDANACSAIVTITVTQPNALVASSTAGTILCNGDVTTVTVTETGGTSPFTNDGVMNNISAGTYSYTVTDNNACSAITTITVTQPNALVASSSAGTILCNAGVTTVTVTETGGTAPFTNDGIMTNISAGSYSYTVTDNNACSATTTITVTQPNALVASSTAGTILCNSGVTTVTVTETGGTSPFTNDGVTSNITAGSYTYTVTDNNSCSATTTITVTQPNALVASSTAGTILCNGGVTTVTVTETGGTSPFTNDGIMSNVSAGTYSYTVTDNNACTSTTTITVIQPNTLVASSTSGIIACNGGVTTVTITETGGTAPFTGDGTNNITAGTYTYIVTDNSGCASTTTMSVSEPNVLVASSTSGTILCNGSVTTVTVTETGGTAPFTNDGVMTNISAGTYSYTVMDANACSAITIIMVTQPSPVDASVSSLGSTITASNASATYQWVDCNNSNAPIAGETNQAYTATANGSYEVIVAEGSCTATSTCTTISTSGVAKQNATNSLQVYPNPFNNQLTIVSAVKTNAILFDMLGSQINTYQLQKTTQTILLGELAPGVYYLQVDTQKIKIIKQ